MPQLVPSQVALPLVGTGQLVQPVPHAVVLVLGTHRLPQLCWLGSAHMPWHGVPLAMQLPLQAKELALQG
jgi:hypothetical protein